MTRIRIATRGSQLALGQSRLVARQIEDALGVTTELVPIKTTGDRIQRSESGPTLAAVGGKGLFVKEIEEALLAGHAEVAIHSAKDLPAELAPGLVLAAHPERADARDAVVGREPGVSLHSLPRGARIGTGSLRRRSQLLALRPDLQVLPLRGNVDTRLRKLEEERLDAVILACAGLDRLGLGERIHERVSPELMLPAVGQGTLALQTRREDPLTAELLALDHQATRIALGAERAFLIGLAGDCNVPLAGHAELLGTGAVRLRGLLASPDGVRVIRAEAESPGSDPEAAGRQVAEAVLGDGGREILDALQAEPGP